MVGKKDLGATQREFLLQAGLASGLLASGCRPGRRTAPEQPVSGGELPRDHKGIVELSPDDRLVLRWR